MTNKVLISIVVIIVIIVAIAVYYTVFQVEPTPTALEQACINAGGTVRTSPCCLATGDFPNMCLVGPCTCAPANSHDVTICDCGEAECWDSERLECVPLVG